MITKIRISKIRISGIYQDVSFCYPLIMELSRKRCTNNRENFIIPLWPLLNIKKKKKNTWGNK